MDRPEASLILGTHNDNAEHLKESIESILHQERVYLEIIIPLVSNEKNMIMLKEWVTKINQQAEFCTAKIVLVRTDDHPGHSPEGSFCQINEGLKHVTKPWIRWFSGNDILYPKATIQQINKLKESGKLVCSGAFTQLNMSGEIIETVRFHPYSRKKHQRGNYINDTSLWSAKLLPGTPFKWQQWGNYSFWDFWLRTYEEYGDVFEYMDSPFWVYRLHKDAMHFKRRKSTEKFNSYNQLRRKFLKTHPLL